MREFDYLIVGGGLAAASAVDGIRAADEAGTILMLTAESQPPYHRPPLSKEFLRRRGAERDLLHVKPENWFQKEARVTLRTKQRVISLDPRELSVTTAGGEEYQAKCVLLATGGRPRTLPVPGADLEGVHTLRTVEDSEALRDAAASEETGTAILVGSGFIGMELAASFTTLGLQVTVVETRERVWPELLPPELSAFVQDYFEQRGVRFRLGSSVAEFRGDRRVRTALLDEGEELPCGVATVGIGILPNDELAGRAGLAVLDGIVVDTYGESSHGYIYAAGDVARFPDPVFGERTRVEHWDHAKAHGRLVGQNMAGDREPYDHLSYFFSDVFDLSLSVFGRPATADRVIVRGELDPEKSLVFCGEDGRLSAAILINANDELERARKLVRRRPLIDEVEKELLDPESALTEVVDV